MALRKVVTKYEPIGGDDYIGNAGDLWIDQETGLAHVNSLSGNPGGNVLAYTDSLGLLNLPGNVIIGSTNDQDVVLWAGEDAEYAGIWWGGDRGDLANGYSTYASITVGNDAGDDMMPSPSGTIAAVNIGENYQWTFNGDDGSFTSAKNVAIDGSEGQFLARQSGGGANGGYSFMYDGGHDTGMFSPNDGVLEFYNNDSLTIRTERVSSHGKATIYGTMTLPPQNAQPTGEAGMLAVCDGSTWDGGSDGLQHLMIYINGSWQKVF
jgi:hypothetical protein